MGQSPSAITDKPTFLSNYDEVEAKSEHGTIICHQMTKQTFLLKLINFADHQQYQKTKSSLQAKKTQVKENVLNLIQLEDQSQSLFCSEIYKLSLIYEFAEITLAQEIEARQSQQRYFEEKDLWSIIQSCLYGMIELSESILLQPNRVYILKDGLVKIIDPDIISNNSWYVFDENAYYSPQRFQSFKTSNKLNTTQKQSMFSFGATILNAAILEGCFDCYEYGSHRFNEAKLDQKLNKLQRLYSQDLKTVIFGLLEIDPETRMSMDDIQQVVAKLANIETEQNQREQQEEYHQSYNHKYSPNQQEGLQKISPKQQPFRDVGNYDTQIVYPNNRAPELSQIPPAPKYKNVEIQQSLGPIKKHQHLGLTTNNQNFHSKFTNYKSVQKSEIQSVSYNFNAHIQPPPTDMRLHSVKAKNTTSLQRSAFFKDGAVKQYNSVYHVEKDNDESLFTDPKLMEQIKRDLIEITARRSLHPSHNNTIQQLTNQRPQSKQSYVSKSQFKTQLPPPKHEPKIYNEEDGKVFEGTIINGKKQGFGKISYPEGPFYLGNFVDDKMHGRGTLFYEQNKPAYDGQWFQDQFHGNGILYNENPLQQNEPFEFNDFNLVQDYWTRYEGQFINDNKQGFGKLFLSNGERFQGYFEKDCINGEGVFYDGNGGRYQGRWDNNILEQRFSRR